MSVRECEEISIDVVSFLWFSLPFHYSIGIPGEKGERGTGSQGPRGLPGPPGKYFLFSQITEKQEKIKYFFLENQTRYDEGTPFAHFIFFTYIRVYPTKFVGNHHKNSILERFLDMANRYLSFNLVIWHVC